MSTTVQKTVTRVKGLGGLMAGFFGVQLFVNIANGGGANSLVPNAIAHPRTQRTFVSILPEGCSIARRWRRASGKR